MWNTSMIPFRVAIPKSVMKPIIEATEKPRRSVHAEDTAYQRERQVQHDDQRVPY